jgi:hypothetical protein
LLQPAAVQPEGEIDVQVARGPRQPAQAQGDVSAIAEKEDDPGFGKYAANAGQAAEVFVGFVAKVGDARLAEPFEVEPGHLLVPGTSLQGLMQSGSGHGERDAQVVIEPLQVLVLITFGIAQHGEERRLWGNGDLGVAVQRLL